MPYAFKRFYDTGNGVGKVSLNENQAEIFKQAIRLKNVGWLLERFFEHARKCQIEVDTGGSRHVVIS
jgi:hypothetical protein